MPFQIVRDDITKLEVDAIVSTANGALLGKNEGIDAVIYAAAGAKFSKKCEKLHGWRVGKVKLTKGYQLPCRYVLHTVVPVWIDGDHNEKMQLNLCYQNSLQLAKKRRCRSIAFPFLASGIYGYPMLDALKVAVNIISWFLYGNEMQVYLVITEQNVSLISAQLFHDIQTFINNPDENQVLGQSSRSICHFQTGIHNPYGEQDLYRRPQARRKGDAYSLPNANYQVSASIAYNTKELGKVVNQVDESFTEMLLRKIDERGMTDAECYKRANIDRKLFSKIRKDKQYRPKKVTVIAFALALRLDLEETKDMLMKAGFALSHSSKFDLIIEYFISRGIYDVPVINEALFSFDQVLIGA